MESSLIFQNSAPIVYGSSFTMFSCEWIERALFQSNHVLTSIICDDSSSDMYTVHRPLACDWWVIRHNPARVNGSMKSANPLGTPVTIQKIHNNCWNSQYKEECMYFAHILNSYVYILKIFLLTFFYKVSFCSRSYLNDCLFLDFLHVTQHTFYCIAGVAVLGQ